VRIGGGDDLSAAVEMKGREMRPEQPASLPIAAEILDAAPDGIIALDHDAQVIAFNPAAESIFGYRRDEVVGKPITETLVPPRFRALFDAAFRAARRTSAAKTGKRLEVTALRKNGAEFPVELSLAYCAPSAAPETHASRPSLPLVIGFARDISPRRQGEQALGESEQRLALAIGAARLGTWDWDVGANVIRWSARHAEIFGYPPTVRQATYEMWRRRVHPEDLAEAESRLQHSLQTGEHFVCEYRIAWPDGTIQWVESHGEVLPDGMHVAQTGDQGNASQPTGGRMIGTVRDITHRKRNDLSLRQVWDEIARRLEAQTVELWRSEQQYRLLAEHATDMISRHSPDGAFLYASPASRTLLGYEPEELVGRDPFEMVHPEDMAATRKANEVLVQRPVVYTVTCRSRRKDGAYVWLEITCRSIHDRTTERVTEIVATTRDVTERRQAEDELQRHLQILRAVMEGTTDAVFVKDLDGRYLMINEAGARLVGKTVAEILGKDDRELFSPETARQVMEGDRKTMASGRTLTYEEVGTAAGVTRTYLSTKGPYRDGEGKVVGLIGISRDISERKRAEEAMQRSEARVRAVLEAVPDPMFRIARDGTYLEFKGAKGFSPYASPEEFLGKRITDVLPAEVAAPCLQLVARAIDEETPQQIEYELIQPDGRHEYETRYVALGPDEVLAIVRDVTQRKRTEAQVRRLLGDLSRAARITTVGEMASGLAHELNQPLMAIVAYAGAATNLLSSRKPYRGELASCLSKLQEEAQAAAEIIRRIRSFVAYREPRLSTVDLNALVRGAVTLDGSWSTDDGTRIELELAEALPLVQADRVLLQQVVVNLIRNARESMAEMPAGERRIVLSTFQPEPKRAAVAVRDCGPGISADAAAHLFEPFHSTKPRGLGLGLSISRSIIEAHHGRLEGETHEQGGAVFRFILPLG
jgi:PAS domain S-box-containing protein